MKTCQRTTADILPRYDASCWMYECLNYKKHHILRCDSKSHQKSDHKVQSEECLLWAAYIKREMKVFLRLSTLLINPESMLLQIISQLGTKSNLFLEFPPTPRPRSRPQNSLCSDLTCKKHKKSCFSPHWRELFPCILHARWFIFGNTWEND